MYNDYQIYLVQLFIPLPCLQELGYKVWIDVENIKGSTLEAMALGIEQAAVVVICASEKYKISPNCRTGKHT